MRITSKGQVTIPQELREQTGLLPHTEVRFEFDGTAVRILPAGPSPTSRGAGVLRNLQGKATSRMTTEQILALTRGR